MGRTGPQSRDLAIRLGIRSCVVIRFTVVEPEFSGSISSKEELEVAAFIP